jgi:hypothetical protein
MARRWWKWLLLAVFALPLLVWGYDRLMIIYWVGGTDLEVEFAVAATSSGDPVPGVRVEVQSEGGFYEEGDKQEFTLVAEADGVARKQCRNSMCFGTRSGLGFTDTYVVHLPWWRFRVTAAGYEPSDWVYLDVPEYVRQVQRAGPRRAKLVVPVSLRKSGPQPGAAPDRGGR